MFQLSFVSLNYFTFYIGNISENTCQAQKKASCLCSMKPFLPEKWNLSVFLFLCVKRIFFQVLFPDLYFSCCGIRSVYFCTRCFFISSDFVVIRLAFFHFLPFQRYFLFIFCNGCRHFGYFRRFCHRHSCCITAVIIVISRVAVLLYFLNIDFLVHQQFVRRSTYINGSGSGCQRIFGTLDAFRYLCFTKVYLCNFASGYISLFCTVFFVFFFKTIPCLIVISDKCIRIFFRYGICQFSAWIYFTCQTLPSG